MIVFLALFLAVFVLNVLPAFAPPTWMLLSFVGFRLPQFNPWLVSLTAALAATCGRLVLALFAQRVTRSRFMSTAMRGNLKAVAGTIERRRAASFIAFLAFAFSPLPSNALFLAYGLTHAPLRLLAFPFFIGRFVSYALAFAGGAFAGRTFEVEFSGGATAAYFLVSQLASLGFVYLFARVDWRASRRDRRLRWTSTA